MRTPRILGAGLALAMLGAVPALAADGGTPAPSASGGAQYGAALRHVVSRPVATLLAVPAAVRADRAPVIRVRFDQAGERRVTARVVVLATPGNTPVAQVKLGWVATGRTIRVPWPKGVRLPAGAYVVRVHAKDRHNHVLARRAHAAGRAVMTVVAAPAPAPAPAPGPAAAVAPAVGAAPAVTPGAGVFPVRGAYQYGDPFGDPRKGYSHQGQDVMTAEGTPVVAPTAGTITVTSYQASAAGYYVVEQATSGLSYFFAHCQKDSTAVQAGQVVAAGAPICHAGHTGDASGPHLHFEVWVNGWRTSSKSEPVDPLPYLQAWAK